MAICAWMGIKVCVCAMVFIQGEGNPSVFLRKRCQKQGRRRDLDRSKTKESQADALITPKLFPCRLLCSRCSQTCFMSTSPLSRGHAPLMYFYLRIEMQCSFGHFYYFSCSNQPLTLAISLKLTNRLFTLIILIHID